MAIMVTKTHSTLLEEIVKTWEDDPNIQQMMVDIQSDPEAHAKFSWDGQHLRRKGTLVVGNNNVVKKNIMD